MKRITQQAPYKNTPCTSGVLGKRLKVDADGMIIPVVERCTGGAH